MCVPEASNVMLSQVTHQQRIMLFYFVSLHRHDLINKVSGHGLDGLVVGKSLDAFHFVLIVKVKNGNVAEVKFHQSKSCRHRFWNLAGIRRHMVRRRPGKEQPSSFSIEMVSNLSMIIYIGC